MGNTRVTRTLPICRSLILALGTASVRLPYELASWPPYGGVSGPHELATTSAPDEAHVPCASESANRSGGKVLGVSPCLRKLPRTAKASHIDLRPIPGSRLRLGAVSASVPVFEFGRRIAGDWEHPRLTRPSDPTTIKLVRLNWFPSALNNY